MFLSPSEILMHGRCIKHFFFNGQLCFHVVFRGISLVSLLLCHWLGLLYPVHLLIPIDSLSWNVVIAYFSIPTYSWSVAQIWILFQLFLYLFIGLLLVTDYLCLPTITQYYNFKLNVICWSFENKCNCPNKLDKKGKMANVAKTGPQAGILRFMILKKIGFRSLLDQMR